jgi:branched-chain amino acid transport system ATP-binding protein
MAASERTQESLLLEARNIEVHFGGVSALSDVSLSVPHRGVVGLIGPNGAGKSTLFAVLTGFLNPIKGSVIFAGDDVSHVSPHRRARLGMGRSFQHTELFGSLTIAEHLLLGYRMGKNRGRASTDLMGLKGWRGPDAQERNRIEELLSMLGLTGLSDQACVALPTGVARLVEVGRVLAMEPQIVMLDEPAAGLDRRETEDLDKALRKVMTDENVSMLIVEHDLEFVFGLSQSITVLDAGVVIASGTPDEIRNDRAVQEAYLGVGYDADEL